MHILLTDRLICPRCGSGFGLILLADRMEDRRVLEGWLGCSNCREQYPVRGGTADLRFPSDLPLDAAAPEEADPEAALRLGALLGVTEGSGPVLIAGPQARHAPAVAALVDSLEVVTIDRNLATAAEQAGVSRVVSTATFPFADHSLRGVALSGEEVASLDEAIRLLAPSGRIVVEGGGPQISARLGAAGLQVLLDQDGVVVASSFRPR